MAWLSTKKAAELERVSPRTMCRNKEQYEFRPVNGVGGESGTKYEFLLESLLDTAQARYHHQTVTRWLLSYACTTRSTRSARSRGGS